MEQMIFEDNRKAERTFYAYTLRLNSNDLDRNKEFVSIIRELKVKYDLESRIWATGIGEYSIVDVESSRYETAVNFSKEVSQRMNLSLIFR